MNTSQQHSYRPQEKRRNLWLKSQSYCLCQRLCLAAPLAQIGVRDDGISGIAAIEQRAQELGVDGNGQPRSRGNEPLAGKIVPGERKIITMALVWKAKSKGTTGGSHPLFLAGLVVKTGGECEWDAYLKSGLGSVRRLCGLHGVL